MKKMQNRAIICLFFAAILVIGTGVYVGKFALHGDEWITYPANRHIYTKGKLTTGVILDKNGDTLIANTKNGSTEYNKDYETRCALLHTTGDSLGNIATGANKAFSDEMVGYNPITGVYSASGAGRVVKLTVDTDIAKTAREALGSRKGTVGIYNYKTGDIVCMVSSPNYDPYDPPKLSADDTSGAYLNRFTSATVVPGSIFKLITATAAIEELPNLDDWSYDCNGSEQYGSYEKDKVKCVYPHGHVDFEEALAKSCNCAFGRLANEVGAKKLEEYTKKSGLMNSYDINGIKTKASTFDFNDNKLNLAWTGIGQSKDLVNPCAMMVYMGAIANGGKTASPKIIKSVEFSNGLPAKLPAKSKTKELVNSDTASKLSDMMRNNVENNYGTGNFPGLDICAKSGTAQNNGEPHAWFTGFLRDKDHPYAFIVLVENSGFGSEVAGRVANTVLQSTVKSDN